MTCAICRTRRPRRFCPGVRGDICAQCCGTERENTVDCPLDCEYLRQAHEFEKPLRPEALPHEGIEISEDFIEEQERLLTRLSAIILRTAMDAPGVADPEVREALAGLSETYITLEKGVLYEHVPQNPVAAQLYHAIQRSIEATRQEDAAAGERSRDSDWMKMLVFLERVAVDRNNGRKRCKAFLSMLHRFHGVHDPEAAPAAASSTLILP